MPMSSPNEKSSTPTPGKTTPEHRLVLTNALDRWHFRKTHHPREWPDETAGYFETNGTYIPGGRDFDGEE